MKFIADLHIHSRHSRATSPSITPETLWEWSQIKGIKVLGTGDFTHPQWLQELKEKLDDCGNGLFKLKNQYHKKIPQSCASEIFFMLTAEISCIYSKNGRTRKIHSVILAPDFATVEKINSKLSRIGNLSSDGRPILGLDAKKLLGFTLDASENTMLIPAHAWTPHFSVFGASSGFDSLEECFEELTPNIYAIETGLSSDPKMNWRLSKLDKITLASNSDAHSPQKLGREANILNTEISYKAITEAIKIKKGFMGTIEFFPEEGKYHYDGHRACNVSLSPSETIQHNYQCPACGKPLTIGVMHRVEKLADRKYGFKPENAPDFYSIIPLQEIIAEALGVGVNSKAVEKEYFNLVEKLGSEFQILLDRDIKDIEKAGSAKFAEAVLRMRQGKIHIQPGFDGEYGKIKIFEKIERKQTKDQSTLF